VTLAFDPEVPHRDALLDGRGLGVGTAARTYAKYRVGESLRVVHRLCGGGHAASRSYPATASADGQTTARARFLDAYGSEAPLHEAAAHPALEQPAVPPPRARLAGRDRAPARPRRINHTLSLFAPRPTH
jgi:hypothetical protein